MNLIQLIFICASLSFFVGNLNPSFSATDQYYRSLHKNFFKYVDDFSYQYKQDQFLISDIFSNIFHDFSTTNFNQELVEKSKVYIKENNLKAMNEELIEAFLNDKFIPQNEEEKIKFARIKKGYQKARRHHAEAKKHFKEAKKFEKMNNWHKKNAIEFNRIWDDIFPVWLTFKNRKGEILEGLHKVIGIPRITKKYFDIFKKQFLQISTEELTLRSRGLTVF